MSSNQAKLFKRAFAKAVLASPGNPADLTKEEHELLLKLSRLHTKHCTYPNRNLACWSKGGYLKGRPWYGDNPEQARKLGLLV